MEVLFLIVWKARQSIALAGVRAQAQAALGGKDAIEAFTDYRDLLNRTEKEDKQKRLNRAFEEMKKIDVIRFKPMSPLGETRKLPRRKH